MKSKTVLWVGIFCLAAVSFVACGKKTRPVPPDTVLPAPIRDLRYQLDEKGVVLTWSYPRRTVQGKRLPYSIKSFELLRAVVPEDDFCEGCPVNFGPPVAVDMSAVDISGPQTVSYSEALLRPKHRYVFRVRSKAGWYQVSKESNTVSFVWEKPPAAPRELAIEAADRALSLSWQEPESLIDGEPITFPLEYQIARSLSGDEFQPLAAEISGTSFTDTNLQNGRRYYYRVRAVRVYKDTRAAGMASRIVSGTPVDKKPPASPQHVTVVQSPEGIRVYWEAVADKDLAGYRIYRRSAGSSRPAMLGEVGSANLLYVDGSPLKGETGWYYSVTAFDRAEPPNESAFSAEVLFDAAP